MTKKQNPMKDFITRLKRLDTKLAKVAPYWWDNSLASSSGATQQAILSISKSLNLDIKSVLDPDAELKFKDVSACYRKAGNKTVNDLLAATGLVHSVSKTAEKIVLNDYVHFSAPSVIREQILASGYSCVNLYSLAEYCWSKGVPVLFLPDLPTSKKMDAVVQEVNGRPVIAITKNKKHESALLFLLAHEMGHVFSGHLDSGQAIIDESINENDEIDQQEMEANSFALALLTGDEGTRFTSRTRLTGEALAQTAKLKGEERHIDPGHIALNWGHTTGSWGVANKALNLLYPELTWQDDLKELFLNNIDELEVGDDELDFLFNLMNIEG
jgi:hypothetical protein